MELGQKVRSIPSLVGHTAQVSHTKLFLAPVTMQVDPELPSNVIFHTWIFFIMQPIQCTTHYCIHLRTRTKGIRDKLDQKLEKNHWV